MGDRHLRAETNQTIWGTGNPVPEFDPTARPGDNLFTNSAISWDPDTGSMNWYFQYTPGDSWDFDEVGTHILIDTVVGGEPRKVLTHSARNGFLYTMDRHNGQISAPSPISIRSTGPGASTRSRQTGRLRPGQGYSDLCGGYKLFPGQPPKQVCPATLGGNNFWPSSYSPKTKMIYIPALTHCETVINTHEPREKGRSRIGGSLGRPNASRAS